jgi:antitoxin Phd
MVSNPLLGASSMPVLSVRNSRGQLVEVESFTATAAKNSFGAVLQKAIAKGIVAITQRDKSHAVLLSIAEYEALLARLPDPLKELHDEFDALVARLQTPRTRAAGQALFKATPAALGKAAVAGARKRG